MEEKMEVRVEEKMDFKKFLIENITVTKAPMVKAYYWDCLGIEKLNSQLASGLDNFVHSARMPTVQINTKPLKIIIWIRNCSDAVIELKLKRIKNCVCVPLETRVGFNQFRHLYHCPHRRLMHILQEFIRMNPDEMVAMSVTWFNFLFGDFKLTYELSVNDGRKIMLDFYVDIIGFDPQKCIITKELVPINVKEHRRITQAIWVRNITMQTLNFQYGSRERGLKIINPNLTVPRQSVWPLMVDYRPSDLENTLELSLTYDGIRSKFPINAPGVLENVDLKSTVPVLDNDCHDFLYVIYPNRIDFNVEISTDRSLIVAVHNYDQKCLEFRWQSYIINDLFEVSYEPDTFRLKPHHSKLCVVNLRVFERSMNFQNTPAVLEVHRIFDKSTKIAKALLTEVESIDDPKWKEDSYMEHVFLHINIKIELKNEVYPEIEWEPPLASPPKKRLQPKKRTTTIFEQLFWEYLAKSNFMRENKKPEINDELYYEQVLRLPFVPPKPPKKFGVTKNIILSVLSQLTAEGLRDVALNWTFIPPDFVEFVS